MSAADTGTFTCCNTAIPWPTGTEDRTCPDCGTVWEREPVDLGAGVWIKRAGEQGERLASCGHPANDDGEYGCSWWPEPAPVPADDTAVASCPAWCAYHPLDSFYRERHHRSLYRYFDTPGGLRIGVVIGMISTATIYVGTMPVRLTPANENADADRMVCLLRALGRDDIADAVEELAATAGQDGVR